MSESPAASQSMPFELRLYVQSPVGTFATTAILFVAMLGSFLAVATLEHVPTLLRSPYGVVISPAAWPALVLSLLCCTALLMQRVTRLQEAKDAAAYAKILVGGAESAARITAPTANGARFGRATIIGLLIGLAIGAFIRVTEAREGHPIPPGTYVWFVSATAFLTILFARGVEQVRVGNRGYAIVLNEELKIDLLRIDTLAVLGRSAARSALIWFVVSAVACLFFVGGDLNGLTILLISSCAVMGIIVFVRIMLRIHHQIRAVKNAELEHVRRLIDAQRATMLDDRAAQAQMHGLLAYEKRISDAHEWPFDQSTLVRVGASAFIVTVPWFGQAIAGYFVEHLTQR